jgi:hypothetical protein
MRYFKRLTDLQSATMAKSRVDVALNEYGFLDIVNRTQPQYNPSYVKYLANYLSDEAEKVKIIIGPYGSGKTSGIINQILVDAVMITPCDDGVRRSRWAIVRNTAAQLDTTVLKSWLFWTEGLPRPYSNKRHYTTYNYVFNDDLGEIQCEVIFIPLDRVDDIRKLDSLELTGCYFNELRHIPKSIFEVIQSRMPRYPEKISFIQLFEKTFTESRKMSKEDRNKLFSKWKPYQSKVYCDTNPPKVRHWIQEIELLNDDDQNMLPKEAAIYHQPPALVQTKEKKWVINREADNLMFVGEQYYLDMIPRGEEFIKVYAQGKYGTIVDGKPVYENYNDDLHSIEEIPINRFEPIYMGWDFGMVSPACLIKQVVGGQIRAIKEFVCDGMSVKSLCETAVIPWVKQNCKSNEVICTHDPANTSEGAKQLLDCGIESLGCRTNHVEPRISAVINNLDRLVMGKSGYLVSRKGCPTLREGFLGEYTYRRLKVIGDEKYVEKPDKVHPYSDIHDCNQYIDILINDELGLKSFKPEAKRNFTYDEEDRSTITGY